MLITRATCVANDPCRGPMAHSRGSFCFWSVPFIPHTFSIGESIPAPLCRIPISYLQGGRILVDGVPLTDINLRSLHRKTAIVAQDTQLFATRYCMREARWWCFAGFLRCTAQTSVLGIVRSCVCRGFRCVDVRAASSTAPALYRLVKNLNRRFSFVVHVFSCAYEKIT